MRELGTIIRRDCNRQSMLEDRESETSSHGEILDLSPENALVAKSSHRSTFISNDSILLFVQTFEITINTMKARRGK